MATPNLYAVTTVTPKTVAIAPTAITATTVYTVTAGKAAMVVKMDLTNVTGAVVVVSVNVVPAGGTVLVGNRVLSALSMAANSTVVPEVSGFFLAEGDQIVVTAAVANSVTAVLSILELS